MHFQLCISFFFSKNVDAHLCEVLKLHSAIIDALAVKNFPRAHINSNITLRLA